jgi:thiamine pyrophosphate-dependent acetolactate synthase large subunit-like protein
VQQIFGVPGEENLDLVEALRRSTIKLVVTRHEQGAAFMAATPWTVNRNARKVSLNAMARLSCIFR